MNFTTDDLELITRFAKKFGMPTPSLSLEDAVVYLNNGMCIMIEDREHRHETLNGTQTKILPHFVLGYEFTVSNYPREPDYTDVTEHWAGLSLYSAMKEARLLEVSWEIENFIECEAEAEWANRDAEFWAHY